MTEPINFHAEYRAQFKYPHLKGFEYSEPVLDPEELPLDPPPLQGVDRPDGEIVGYQVRLCTNWDDIPGYSPDMFMSTDNH